MPSSSSGHVMALSLSLTEATLESPSPGSPSSKSSGHSSTFPSGSSAATSFSFHSSLAASISPSPGASVLIFFVGSPSCSFTRFFTVEPALGFASVGGPKPGGGPGGCLGPSEALILIVAWARSQPEGWFIFFDLCLSDLKISSTTLLLFICIKSSITGAMRIGSRSPAFWLRSASFEQSCACLWFLANQSSAAFITHDVGSFTSRICSSSWLRICMASASGRVSKEPRTSSGTSGNAMSILPVPPRFNASTWRMTRLVLRLASLIIQPLGFWISSIAASEKLFKTSSASNSPADVSGPATLVSLIGS
mmetsp:Transcript_28502/g.75232  ORF Transcript_28502/g.75232 Transcript_28502/m.75232 type:complete len:308 (-) Transcript_28502:202-1125(-)